MDICPFFIHNEKNKYCLCQYCHACDEKACVVCVANNSPYWTKIICKKFAGHDPYDQEKKDILYR